MSITQLVKHYGATPDAVGTERKNSPGECCGISKHRVLGRPIKELVSTSYVEKHNQTMRQHMRRFARLTAAHPKKLENHAHMVALYTCWYNFRPDQFGGEDVARHGRNARNPPLGHRRYC